MARRKRLVFLFVTALTPFLFFFALELLLTLFHYGPDLSLFVREEIGGKAYLVVNPDVKARYFSRTEFSPTTSPDYFRIPKPAGTYRIFCLGGSTTIGFPYGPVGSFSTFLRDRLHRIFPHKSFEVINLGMTATNSYSTLDIIREALESSPDLFLVYDGHNEFYGALGVASTESLGPARWLTHLYLKLIRYRTFLLLRSGYERLRSLFGGSSNTSTSGTMMERLARGQEVPYRGAVYAAALNMFKANFHDVVALASARHVPVILATQVSNIRDQVPFVSLHDDNVSPAARSAFAAAMSRGDSALAAHALDSAAQAFDEAIRLDTSRADARFRHAQALDASGLHRKAEADYIAARDLDRLRFRCSSDFNDVIRQQEDGSTVFVADMVQLFRESSPDSLVGNSLILEHLHPNSRGYFLMAGEYARIMRSHELLATAEEWQSADTVTGEALWNSRAMTELDEYAAQRRTEILTSSWPFRPEAKRRASPIARPLANIAEHLVHGEITWERAHVQASEYYAASNDDAHLEAEYRLLINQLPINVSAYLLLSRLYLRQERFDLVRTTLLQSFNVERTSYALRVLGSIALDSGAADSALVYIRQADALASTPHEHAEAVYLQAIAFAKQGRMEDARAALQRALNYDPMYAPARALVKKIGVHNP